MEFLAEDFNRPKFGLVQISPEHCDRLLSELTEESGIYAILSSETINPLNSAIPFKRYAYVGNHLAGTKNIWWLSF
jgi:hypothetical protein